MLQIFYKVLMAGFLGIAHPEEKLIDHIEQLTSPKMGFEKAGEAYFSPDDKMISFQAVPKGENSYQIYTMNLETKETAHISCGFHACTCSYFHPNGKKIIFAASPIKPEIHKGDKYKWDFTPYMNIYEANLDGSELVALTFGPDYHAECAYSPDGKHIVYASNENGSMNIYVMKSDGTGIKQLTHTTHCYNGGPFFSPDGNKIIFRSDRVAPDLLQIYMMDKDGTNLVQLTDNGCVNWAPFWHPSQDIVAFTTSIHGHHNYEIYLISISTRKLTRVTYHPAFNGLPTFNLKGNKIMWTSKRGEDNTSQVFIADFTLPEE